MWTVGSQLAYEFLQEDIREVRVGARNAPLTRTGFFRRVLDRYNIKCRVYFAKALPVEPLWPNDGYRLSFSGLRSLVNPF